MKKVTYIYFLLLIPLIFINCAGVNNFHKVDITSTFHELAYNNNGGDDDFPLVINDKVVNYIKIYRDGARNRLTQILSRGHKYMPMMKQTLQRENLPEELAYLPIIESGFNPAAYSPKHASGPWQFVKGTGRAYGLESSWWVDERRNVEKSTLAAARHLKDLYNWLKDWYLALAAYNAGGGKVSKAIKKYKTRDFWQMTKRRWGVFRKETMNYVPKFIAVTIICENLEHFGFTEIAREKPVMYDTVSIPDATDLNIIAECCNSTFEEIKFLNPELKRWATPPKYENYQLRIPYGSRETFLANFNKILPEDRITFRRHKIKKGESVWSIAKKYDIPRDMLIEMNKLGRKSRIVAGKYLIVPIRGLEKAKEIDKMLDKEKFSRRSSDVNEL
ncbi:MAG: transglycosylase SLT domain-containing protein [Spirochaetes bacterium]|nr:transglycosylase SLT domain-containing protein [Spirochaetota bacterium]